VLPLGDAACMEALRAEQEYFPEYLDVHGGKSDAHAMTAFTGASVSLLAVPKSLFLC
jgi:hypothetical protein